MRFKQFWELAEVYTAPLNLFLILLGASYAQFQFDTNLNGPFVIYLFIILLFHVAVNIFNNYMDYQNASDDHSYKVKTNIIGREGLSLKTVRNYFYFFMTLSTLFGLWLVTLTSIWVVIPGIIGFYIGLFYSTGPRPLNSLPIAETITSLASGYLVPLVALYVLLASTQEPFTLAVALRFLLVCLPLVFMMFNNLIANNTCDLEEDIVNGRRTLVYYLGKKRATVFLKANLLISFLCLPLVVFLGLAPWTVLLLGLSLPKLMRGLTPYMALQDKQKTFPIVLKTMSVVMIGYPTLYFLGTVLSYWF
ncbi:prenyltransferase [Enterococcus aquimarinus]|uniref:Prenyltransferase n=1 Tax=Enterococcus aquimarinus TaxID=328396 RepID=A0A1L8QRL4_9ENTE|nr:prenyltransferase [Enterococcus aquimarinus]OJG10119.1 hypothetical protein RU93_GL000369 [Enterococcus aquimarinus]